MRNAFGLLALALVLIVFTFSSCERSTTGNDQESSTAQLSTEVLQVDAGSMFTGHENHFISTATGRSLIGRYETAITTDANGWYFARDAMLALLAQDSVVGLRIYHALKDNGEYTPVIFGVTPDGQDLDAGHRLGKSIADSSGIVVLELAYPCPPYCP